MASPVSNTIAFLRHCQQLRTALGHAPQCTRDPEWLVNMAINRRAGWPEDPWARDCAMPVRGRLPRKAHGDEQRHLCLIAHTVNMPRVIIRAQSLGEWREYLLRRIPGRFTTRRKGV